MRAVILMKEMADTGLSRTSKTESHLIGQNAQSTPQKYRWLTMVPFHKKLSKGHVRTDPQKGIVKSSFQTGINFRKAWLVGRNTAGKIQGKKAWFFLFKPEIIKSTLYLYNARLGAVITTQKGKMEVLHINGSLKTRPMCSCHQKHK